MFKYIYTNIVSVGGFFFQSNYSPQQTPPENQLYSSLVSEERFSKPSLYNQVYLMLKASPEFKDLYSQTLDNLDQLLSQFCSDLNANPLSSSMPEKKFIVGLYEKRLLPKDLIILLNNSDAALEKLEILKEDLLLKCGSSSKRSFEEKDLNSIVFIRIVKFFTKELKSFLTLDADDMFFLKKGSPLQNIYQGNQDFLDKNYSYPFN